MKFFLPFKSENIDKSGIDILETTFQNMIINHLFILYLKWAYLLFHKIVCLHSLFFN